jgi:hypothetical protein
LYFINAIFKKNCEIHYINYNEKRKEKEIKKERNLRDISKF